MHKTYVCERCTFILSNFRKVCKNCSFVKCYFDKRGTIYFIRPGIRQKGFRTYFLRQGDEKQCEYDKLSIQPSFAEAQSALNAVAREKKWSVYDGVSPSDWSVVV